MPYLVQRLKFVLDTTKPVILVTVLAVLKAVQEKLVLHVMVLVRFNEAQVFLLFRRLVLIAAVQEW